MSKHQVSQIQTINVKALYFTPAYCSPNPELASFYSEYGLETHDSVS